MNEWQQTICAIALFADGYSNYQVSQALGVSKDRAQELIQAGADAQAAGRMGHMKQHRDPTSRDPDYSKRG